MPSDKKEARPSNRGGRSRTPAFVKNHRGVKNWKEAGAWLEWRGIEDIECITPDQAGIARGKMMPSKKFTSNTSLALPSAVFMATISGGYPEDGNGFSYPEDDGDLKLMPDLGTLSAVPWETDPTAQVICDLVHQDGRQVEFTPRNLLKKVLAAYEARGLTPVVAPEIEFYLVRKNPDPDYPLTPPVGRSGRPIGGGAGYSIAGVNEFDELIDDIYHFSEAQGLEIDTLIHEEGAGQLEINLRHGHPVELADQVFLFKRTIREAALKHETYATFMAKPMQGQPGSAMHIHQSIVKTKSGRNLFTNEDGSESEEFLHFIGGMQKHVPNALVMFAPYVNSYRRLTQAASAPVNNKWGYDNRTTAFRVPRSDPAARRVENRIPSSDANPYLALAASLACGLIGLTKKLKPDAPILTTANEDEIDLPRGLLEAVDLFEDDKDLREVLGESFVSTYAAIKRAEFETFMEVISPWEREFLLLNVQAMKYQTPISPGYSWYEETAGPRPDYPALDGDLTVDVVIIGGGFTGLSAAVHLARAGASVALVEAHRIGDGASGRNGGQIGTGQRSEAEELEKEYGFARAKALFDLAEEAKAHLFEFTSANGIDIDFRPGHMSVCHRERDLPGYVEHVEAMAGRFGYAHMSYMDAAETHERMGSEAYFGGVRDTGTGHIHPLKLVIGTARVAAEAGAKLFENTKATGIANNGGKVVVTTAKGTITAKKGLIAVNAYGGNIEPETASHIMPIGSFIGATVPLGDDSPVLPGGESVADSRFVVRYFRRTKTGELLFGGREVYTPGDAGDIGIHIRKQITEIYPALKDVQMTHAWGGYVGITLPRKPFVREVMPNVIAAGGYSGHGVMLSNFMGKLYAETVAGNRDRLKLFEDLKIPPFPGGRRFRAPLLFLALNWYALRDRF